MHPKNDQLWEALQNKHVESQLDTLDVVANACVQSVLKAGYTFQNSTPVPEFKACIESVHGLSQTGVIDKIERFAKANQGPVSSQTTNVASSTHRGKCCNGTRATALRARSREDTVHVTAQNDTACCLPVKCACVHSGHIHLVLIHNARPSRSENADIVLSVA